MDSASGIVSLTADEAERIDRLPKEEVQLLAPVRAVARIEGEDVARRRAAPPPTTQRAGVMHVRHAPAYTYAMKIEGAAGTLFKIGWAFDYKKRERDFNSSIAAATWWASLQARPLSLVGHGSGGIQNGTDHPQKIQCSTPSVEP